MSRAGCQTVSKARDMSRDMALISCLALIDMGGDGVGNIGNTRLALQGLSGRKAGNLKEVVLGWINRG